jgi:hypothetical protein
MGGKIGKRSRGSLGPSRTRPAGRQAGQTVSG